VKKIYNKLVRDKIPQIIQNKGGIAQTVVLSEEDYLKELNIKLQEEVKEYLESGEVEEIADILEVLLALAKQKGLSYNELEEIRDQKVKKRGAFNDKIFLISVEE